MRFAQLFNLAFSTGGLLLLLVVLCAWLLLRPRSRAPRIVLSLVVAWYTVISIYPIPNAVRRVWSRGFAPLTRADVPPGKTLVVVLGSGSFTAFDWARGRTAVLDPIGLTRTLEAARVYALVDPVWVVNSGGLRDPASPALPLGETMRDTLVRLGVPPARLIVKDEALDTHDEAQTVARLLPTLGVDHVVLVTSGLHMRRAVATFRAAGIPVIPAPARQERIMQPPWRTRYLPSQVGLDEASHVAHELLGWVYYGLKGWR